MPCNTCGKRAIVFRFQSSIYYITSGNNLITSSGQILADFNYSFVMGDEPIFHDGIYYPIVDINGDNLWVGVRHIAADPNGTAVGVDVFATRGTPFRGGGFGGWAGFLYQFDL